jgi:NADH-quinone oxidoreductase subunit H
MDVLLAIVKDPLAWFTQWLTNLLTGWGMPDFWVSTILMVLGVFWMCIFGLALVIFLIWGERKTYARIQDRLGPNRIGPWGILQTFPDMVKIFTKEHITPAGADIVTFNLAPILSVSAVLLVWAVVPLAPTYLGSDINVGVLYVLGVGSIGMLGIILAGWSSNNKYALLGAFRAVSQMVSYEVPMALALLIPVLMARSMGMSEIVNAQGVWFVVLTPIAALIFLITSQAELGRAPFDLLEAESEIVAGYQIEYSGLKFGMFFVGEFLHAYTVSGLVATLFLGGWRGPGVEVWPLLGILYFVVKTVAVYFLIVLMRISLPRLRIDQISNLNWKLLTPLALVTLMLTAILEKALMEMGIALATSPVVYTLAHLTLNAVIFAGLLLAMRRSQRRRDIPVVGEPRPVAVPPKAVAPKSMNPPQGATSPQA